MVYQIVGYRLTSLVQTARCRGNNTPSGSYRYSPNFKTSENIEVTLLVPYKELMWWKRNVPCIPIGKARRDLKFERGWASTLILHNLSNICPFCTCPSGTENVWRLGHLAGSAPYLCQQHVGLALGKGWPLHQLGLRSAGGGRHELRLYELRTGNVVQLVLQQRRRHQGRPVLRQVEEDGGDEVEDNDDGSFVISFRKKKW